MMGYHGVVMWGLMLSFRVFTMGQLNSNVGKNNPQ